VPTAVIGVKRQPLYLRAPRPLDLDAKVPSQEVQGLAPTASCSSDAEGRDYLEWMSENFGDADIRAFTRRVAPAGEEVAAAKAGPAAQSRTGTSTGR
jgi:hypothetical protein